LERFEVKRVLEERDRLDREVSWSRLPALRMGVARGQGARARPADCRPHHRCAVAEASLPLRRLRSKLTESHGSCRRANG
jgi:hypothetical protein